MTSNTSVHIIMMFLCGIANIPLCRNIGISNYYDKYRNNLLL